MPLLTKRLAERKRMEALQRVADYRTQLQIAVAPHTEKGAGINQMLNQLAELEKDIKNPERVQERRQTRDKLNELLLKQAAKLEKEG